MKCEIWRWFVLYHGRLIPQGVKPLWIVDIKCDSYRYILRLIGSFVLAIHEESPAGTSPVIHQSVVVYATMETCELHGEDGLVIWAEPIVWLVRDCHNQTMVNPCDREESILYFSSHFHYLSQTWEKFVSTMLPKVLSCKSVEELRSTRHRDLLSTGKRGMSQIGSVMFCAGQGSSHQFHSLHDY